MRYFVIFSIFCALAIGATYLYNPGDLLGRNQKKGYLNQIDLYSFVHLKGYTIDDGTQDSLEPEERRFMLQVAELFDKEGLQYPYAQNIGKKLKEMVEGKNIIKGQHKNLIGQVSPYPFLLESGWKPYVHSSWLKNKRGSLSTGIYMALSMNFLEYGYFEGVYYGSPQLPASKSRILLTLTLYHETIHAYEHFLGFLIGHTWYGSEEFPTTTETIAFARHLRKRIIETVALNLFLPVKMNPHISNLYGKASLKDTLESIEIYIKSEQNYRWKEVGEASWRKILDAYFTKKIPGEKYVQKTSDLMKEYEVQIEFDSKGDYKIAPKG